MYFKNCKNFVMQNSVNIKIVPKLVDYTALPNEIIEDAAFIRSINNLYHIPQDYVPPPVGMLKSSKVIPNKWPDSKWNTL